MIVLLSACSAITPVWAQPPICSYNGTVTLDGAAAPGAAIEARVGSTVVGTATALGTSNYYMLVVQDSGVPSEGQTVDFYVNGFLGGTSTWEEGETKTLNLAAVSGPLPPTVTTGVASGISNNAATLNGSVDTMGDYTQVRVRFQYGTTAAYGTNTAWQTVSSSQAVSAAISTLSPLTQYHFRIQLETLLPSNTVTVNGADMTFTTLAGPPWPFIKNLGEGWCVLSTPVKLQTGGNRVTEIMSSFEIAYRWTGSAWQQIGTIANNPTWIPLEAYYIKVPSGGATATFNPTTNACTPATRTLPSGSLAFVGSSPAFDGAGFPAMPLTDVLAGVAGNYTSAVAPALGQTGWTYVPGGAVVPNVEAFGGFWLFVNTGNNRTLMGFSTTPLSNP